MSLCVLVEKVPKPRNATDLTAMNDKPTPLKAWSRETLGRAYRAEACRCNKRLETPKLHGQGATIPARQDGLRTGGLPAHPRKRGSGLLLCLKAQAFSVVWARLPECGFLVFSLRTASRLREQKIWRFFRPLSISE